MGTRPITRSGHRAEVTQEAMPRITRASRRRGRCRLPCRSKVGPSLHPACGARSSLRRTFAFRYGRCATRQGGALLRRRAGTGAEYLTRSRERGRPTGGDVSLKNLLMCDDALRRRDEGDFPALARLMASRRGRVMIIRDVLASSSLALVLSSGASYSGPCTQQISDVRHPEQVVE